MLSQISSRAGRLSGRALAAAVALSIVGAGSAAAAPAIDRTFPAPTPNAQPDPFYTPPESIPVGDFGDVIRVRPSKAGPPAARNLANAWQVMYLSTGASGQRNVVTGTILVPKDADSKTLPIVGLGPGTTGPAFKCTVSRFINSGSFYEQSIVNALLTAGYAVAVTDYEGYHENPKSTYIVGKAVGSALIDVVRAATKLPEAGLSATPKVAFQGFSQGGAASLWAGQLQPTYAPELNVVGVSAGGVPSDLVATLLKLQGSPYFGFAWNALIGLDNAFHGELKFDTYLNDAGRQITEKMNSGDCTIELVLDYKGKWTDDYMTKSPFALTAWTGKAKENILGKTAIPSPVYQYHASNDPIVPFAQDETVRNAYCALGMKVEWKVLDTGHITTVSRGNPGALAFLADRFAGKPATSNCPTPAS